MISPRENMLRTLKCEEPEWIPVTVYVDPYNHPNPDSLPESLASLFREKISCWDKRCELFIPLSEYLGVNEYMIDAPYPYEIVTVGDVEQTVLQEGDEDITLIRTPIGELRQISKYGYLKKHYVESYEDLLAFIEFVKSWRIRPKPESITAIKSIRNAIKDNGVIRGFGVGTPLGMMYRKFTEVTNLIYLLADYPEEIEILFGIMEEKYMEIYKFILENCPEIDLIRGMDDTSTTVISPSMFDKYNVDITNKRADLVHEHGKLYFHHSCGLIHDLLPIYKKTKINGVDAFTPPPIGDVTYSEGRKLAGDNISFISAFTSGLSHPDKETYEKTVKLYFEEAKKARYVHFDLATPDYTHGVDFMKKGLEEARKYQKL